MAFLRDKKFLRIAAYVTAGLLLVLLIVTFVFPAGIYSCRDGAAIVGVPTEQLEGWVKTCHFKQDTGTVLALLVFWPVLLGGLITNWFILPHEWIGGAGFLLGAIPVVVTEVYLATLILYKLSVRRYYRGTDSSVGKK